ncbi:MAG: T9SS type A sorting domain-containing protein [Bacteroidota bacterium]|nr:T9SS type A sorting domain-containing protein [Bacteroidota bacterium]MDX5431570.1 T9SS type A sorting domain-containing protein [Bacteroidota bacterium]MDX5470291.1 T9SS type A sorting domain-containing protein [Bacteroidota bacterium]
MRTLLTLAGALVLSTSMAQKMYQMTPGNETYYPGPSPYSASMPGWDNDPIEYIQLGFDFEFHGKKYSEFHISPNGNIYFDLNNPLNSVIDPFGTDLWDNPNDGDTARILISTIGSPGAKVKIIAWENARFKNGAESDVANFQIRLFEANGQISFVYGDIVASAGAFGTNSGPFCGLWDDNTTTYLFLHGDPASPSLDRKFALPFPNLNGVPVSGTRYTFTQEVNSVDHALNLGVNVFPNPANHLVNIALENGQVKTVALFNVAGQKIEIDWQIEGDQATLNVAGLPEGIYVLKVEDELAVRSSRITVKH